jgi:hypothetical protein
MPPDAPLGPALATADGFVEVRGAREHNLKNVDTSRRWTDS